MTHIAIGPRLRKPVRWFVTIKAQTSLRIYATLLSAFWEESSLDLPRAKKINFLSSLFSRRDWFETPFVGNSEDRFSRVLACVACSTALGQIFQVQQIIILKTNIMRRLFIGYINGNHIIWLHSTSSNTQAIRNYAHRAGGRRGLWFPGYRSLVWPCTNSAFTRLVRGYKWLVHIISFVFMRQSFVTTPTLSSDECRELWLCVCSSP